MGRAVARVNALESEVGALSDEALKGKTQALRGRRQQGEPLEQIIPEAFAVVREVARRTLDMRHFDVQLIGGITLHEGHIAEMRTGEGKTLVATLPAYLNALDGQSVHIVTVNDYLARRDAEWMGAIYGFLGLRTGVVVPGQSAAEKREAYAADVVYGTNNEFGFDYLRDNMAFRAADKMQGALRFAIVDEVDSILIDEARTPLIISGPTDENSELYIRVNRLIPFLSRQEEEDGPGDFSVDEKAKQVFLTEDGHQKIEHLLIEEGLLAAGESLYDATNIVLMHHVNAGLRAHSLFSRNVEYIVTERREVVIVDEFTGRTMPGRRWSEGLHQAVEAKEGVPIQNENQTLASITFQNYFRLYDKLAGMTGTADTEAPEFQQIYGLEVMVIPHPQAHGPRRPRRRRLPDEGREVRVHHHGHRRLPDPGPAGAGGHRFHRDLRVRLGAARRQGRRAPGPERQASRSGSRDHHARGAPGNRHHRHQHGRPRHRHRARGQSPGGAVPPGGRGRERAQGAGAGMGRTPPAGRRRGRPPHRGHRTPRVAPGRQPASRPLRASGRSGVDPVLPFRSKTT